MKPSDLKTNINAGDGRERRFVVWYEKNRQFRFGGKTLSEWATPHRPSPDTKNSYYDNTHIGEKEVIRFSFASIHIERRLITTTDGRVGLARHDCKQGDLICILFGGRMPFILRPQNGHYIFIGECHIPGLMEGQAIEEHENGKFHVQDFELH